MKTLRYLLEASLLWLVFSFLSMFSIERASAMGGFLGRMLGRAMTRKNAIARANIKASLPDLDETETERIIRGMWDNLGRFVGETPHLHKIDVYHGDRVSVTADVDLDNPATTPMPAIFFNAHFGNFEVSSLLAIQRGLDLTLVYREASNPWSEKIIQHWRNKRGGTWVPKGRDGARALLASIRNKGAIAILADQKFNEGVAVPFFGRDAMTAPAIAELALKYDVPLVPGARAAPAQCAFQRPCLQAHRHPAHRRQGRRCARHPAGGQPDLRILDPRVPRSLAVDSPPLARLRPPDRRAEWFIPNGSKAATGAEQSVAAVLWPLRRTHSRSTSGRMGSYGHRDTDSGGRAGPGAIV